MSEASGADAAHQWQRSKQRVAQPIACFMPYKQKHQSKKQNCSSNEDSGIATVTQTCSRHADWS